MIPRLQEIDPVSTDEVHHTVLLCEATRPCAGCEIFQGLWLADPPKRISQSGFDKIERPQGNLAIHLDPITQVFAELRMKYRVAFSSSRSDGLTLFDQAQPLRVTPPRFVVSTFELWPE